MRLLIAFATFALLGGRAVAWNALGHKVIASIAYDQLSETTRKQIADTIRRNPRFDDDFAPRMPAEDQDRYIFQTAAVWPDVIRGNREYDLPGWHYVDFPLFVGPERPVDFPLGTKPQGELSKWNVMQAVAFCRGVLADDKASAREKAIAYCWVFHLVGDLHQPCHSTALVCEKLPKGDRGGNSIPLVTGRNLHSLWDNLLGRADKPNDVKRALFELKQHPDWWKVDTKIDVPAWVAESHELAKSFVYCPEILSAVEQPGELQPLTLPEAYLKSAGDRARQRVVAAGLRLAVVLKTKGKPVVSATEPGDDADDLFSEAAEGTAAAALTGASASATLTHWLNLNGNVRHNSGCKFFENTKRGRLCGPDEGKACGICGG